MSTQSNALLLLDCVWIFDGILKMNVFKKEAV